MKSAGVGGLILALLCVACFAAPAVEAWLGISAEVVDILNPLAPPSLQHPLGTDDLGRDVLVRLLRGGQVSLLVGLVGAAASVGIGTAVGVLAGTVGGRIDALIMRLVDGMISLPLLPFLIVLAAVDPVKVGFSEAFARSPEMGLLRLSIIIALFGWTTSARLVRSVTLSLREQPFVLAAYALGGGTGWVVRRHLLPNVMPIASVAGALSVGQVILLESALSFLGLGISPPMPSWGNMLTGALEMLWNAPLLALWPGLLILLTVVAVNLMGEGLRQRKSNITGQA